MPGLAIDDVAVEEHEIGLVRRTGDEPLLAVEDVLTRRRVADRGRLERRASEPAPGSVIA